MKYLVGFIILILIGTGVFFFIKQKNIQQVSTPYPTTYSAVQQVSPTTTYAKGSSSIVVSPHSGSYSTTRTLTSSIIVSSDTEEFNAAQATVAVSQNIKVTKLTPGNCHFTYVTKPTEMNPSFAGAILGGRSSSCTVYTLTLQPINTGVGSVTITNATIVSQSSNKSIKAITTNGSYIFQ